MRPALLCCGLLWAGALLRAEEPASAPALDLQQAVRRALQEATAVQKAEHAASAAGEALLQGYAQFLPEVDVAGDYQNQRGNFFYFQEGPVNVGMKAHGYDFGLNSSLNLFNGLSDYAGLRSALERRQAAKLTLERARQEIALDVTQAYLQIKLDERLIKVAEENLSASQERERLLDRQTELGARSLADLYRQQAQTSSDRAFAIQTRNRRRDDLIFLLRRLRLDPASDYALAEVDLDTATVPAAEGDEARLIAAAVKSRPDLNAAFGQFLAARKDALAAQAGFWPRLDLGWGMSSMARELFQSESNGVNYLIGVSQEPLNDQLVDHVNYTVSLTATWSLFSRLTTRLAERKATLAAEDAEIDYQDLRLQVAGDVRQAAGDLRAADQTLDAARKGEKAAQQSYDATRTRYDVGASSLLDLLTAQTVLLQAKAALAQAEIGFYLQVRQMEFALGRMPSVAAGT
jgi:outer membrane protein